LLGIIAHEFRLRRIGSVLALFLQNHIGQSCKVNLNRFDLISFDPEKFHAAEFAVVVSRAFVTNESFVALFKKPLNLKGSDILAVRPASVEIGGLIDVIVERTGESEIVAQNFFYRLPIFCFVGAITPANQI
jgi:hypothetical protein